MSNLIILAILIAAAILLTWLGRHAWRAKRPFVRWPARQRQACWSSFYV
jgi:threonine/homoserine/homoserine lactone efflux protein